MDFKELIVYKKAFTLAMEVYEVLLNYMMLHPGKFGCKSDPE